MTVESPEYVQFPVPKDRITDVAIFLYGHGEAMPEATEAPPAPKVPMSGEQRNELLTRIYMESEPTFRRLLILLAERPQPDKPMYYPDVRKAMGYTNPRKLPGALGAYGRRTSHRYNKFWPFVRQHDAVRGQYYLTMTTNDAAFLRELHTKRQKRTLQARTYRSAREPG
jgi:hypothetical protein